MRTILVSVLSLASLALMAGCFHANVDVDADGWARKLDDKMASSEAKSIACRRVRAEGLDEEHLDKYETKATRQDNAWWVSFDAKRGQGGWPASFAVRVDENGKTTVYMGD
jgi:hypothetical protein